MRKKHQHRGFSLTEVLLALGTIAVGMTFVGGTFLVGIYFSTIATERTIAAVVADEAFAKIRLYGVNPTDPNLAVSRPALFETLNPIAPEEFAYPSTKTPAEKQYYWSALCRPAYSDLTNRLVQVTVFVSRKAGNRTTYPGGTTRPVPVQVGISAVVGAGNENMLRISSRGEQSFVNDGSTIVDNQTGQIYRVMRRDADAPSTILLDRPWQGGLADSIWVVPPPVGGGRYPCIAVYQKVIRF